MCVFICYYMSIYVYVVLFIIVFIFLLYLYFKHKHNIKQSDYFEDGNTDMFSDITNFSEIEGGGSQISTDITKFLENVRWPQVYPLNNAILQLLDLSKFHYTEKTDGIHKNILLHNGTVYDITDPKNKNVLINDVLYKDDLILDTELYNDKFYIFDVVYAKGEFITERNFIERLGIIKDIDLGNSFVVKEFRKIPNVDFLINFLKHDISPLTKNEIDGVIIQAIDKPYASTHNSPTIYKMKPRCFQTIDFLLKYNSINEIYNLYLIGSKFDYFNNLKFTPTHQDIIYDSDGNSYERKEIISKDNINIFPKSLFILFDNPYIPNLSTYKVTETWNKRGYYRRAIDAINYNISSLITHPDKYDNVIVEMSLTYDNVWVPLRIRDDKKTPNGYRIGIDTLGLIFDPIKNPENVYFQKKLTTKQDIQTVVHKINDLYRKFIIEKYIQQIGTNLTIIDLCCGRGADQKTLFENGCVNLFGIDNDTTALKQYVDRSYNIRNIKYIPFHKSWKRSIKGFQRLNLNVLNHCLGNNYDKVLDDLRTRVEWRGKCDVIIMNFSIHYLCSSVNNIRKLANFVNEILTNNGIFIFTYFDGDYIYKNHKNDIGPFKIKIVKDTTNVVIAKMPMPTIQSGDDIYRDEPLVFSSVLNNINRKLKLVKEFDIYDETKLSISKIDDYDKVIDYYRLVKARIYTRT